LLAGAPLEFPAEGHIDNLDLTEPETGLRHETHPELLEQAMLAPAERHAETNQEFPGVERTDMSGPVCPAAVAVDASAATHQELLGAGCTDMPGSACPAAVAGTYLVLLEVLHTDTVEPREYPAADMPAAKHRG
jgi:hypothetical protein